MKRIKLTKEQYAIVDDDDYRELSSHKWFALKRKSNYYASRAIKHKDKGQVIVNMHRVIMGRVCRDGACVDHINHDTLDNRKMNLRVCTKQENSRNMRTSHGTSRYKGVYYYKPTRSWQAHIYFNDKKHHLGYFGTEIKAAEAYNNKANEIFGKYAHLNIINYTERDCNVA